MMTPGSRVTGEHLRKYDPRKSAREQQEQLSVGARAESLPRPTFLRRIIGLFGGLVGAGLMFLVMPGDMDVWPRLTAATAVLMAVWWMTEAIPIPATALVPLVVFPMLVPAAEAGDEPVTVDVIGANYGHNIIFLFMGGFMLALAMQRWNLHRRIALLTLRAMGSKPVNLIGGFMIATAFLSMWVSNTATAVMMLPIGISVLMLVQRIAKGEDPGSISEDDADPAEKAQAVKSNFGTALMLGIAYAASVGSVSTIIGTPPNALLVGHMSTNHDVTIGFGQWMLVGVPIAIVMLVLVWVVLTRLLFRPEIKTIPGGSDLIRGELRKLGPMSSGELRVLLIFILAAVSWVSIPLGTDLLIGAGVLEEDTEPFISDAGIAMVVGLLLFLLPGGANRGVRLLDWEYAAKLPWGVLLLFGGGLALSSQFSASGLSSWMGEQMEGLSTVPVWVLVLLAAAGVLILTEMTSNTATAATFLPVASGVAMGTGVDPLVLAAPVALAATCAFMLPVATPPNAIAYGSGYVTIGQMVKGGILLNVAAVVVITLVSMTLLLWVFGLSL
ncbi:SLC13 family permease [Nesterenkonia xinjiangensis]|uniref:Sodium-dependent dicarboxylate transporter SdcS n=1 Tax=Nesterenkonia xinjiangensis TaxID=225327 RepID=A0A7Z0GJ01_9MICC|nr:DASS family sodium-coupled anion symporter [Nesterenkonia xinjiangensis]NYJ76877.1 sodium-dependent dicarboxylate transporter 2/3/5 [Nesterenkonia xinjiangensis]